MSAEKAVEVLAAADESAAAADTVQDESYTSFGDASVEEPAEIVATEKVGYEYAAGGSTALAHDLAGADVPIDNALIEEPDAETATPCEISGPGMVDAEEGPGEVVEDMDDCTSKCGDIVGLESVDTEATDLSGEDCTSFTDDDTIATEEDNTKHEDATEDPVEDDATDSMLGAVQDSSDDLESEISYRLDQAKLDESVVTDEPVEIVATDSMLDALNKGSDDVEVDNDRSDHHTETKLGEGDCAEDGKESTINDISDDDNMDDDPNDSSSDELQTIFEIQGVDSSSDSLPDSMQQNIGIGPSSPNKRNQSPVKEFLQSERRAKLRKANAVSDFEMQQLNHQMILTQQCTNEVLEMRKEQTRLEGSLEREKQEIASRNESLRKELAQLQVSAAQIAQAEAEVAMLANEYQAQMILLEQEKEQMRYNIMMMTMQHSHMINQTQAAAGTMQPNIMMNQIGHDINGMMQPPACHQVGFTTMQPAIGIQQGNEKNHMTPQVPTASQPLVKNVSADSNGTHSSKAPMVERKMADGSTKQVSIYSKGMSVYYKNTATKAEIPAIILDVHQDDMLEPYYSIRMEDGREKQTDNGHIRLLEIGVSNKDQDDLTWGGGCGFSDSY